MKISNFEVRKDDLSQSRVTSSAAPALNDGEVLVEVDRFAITANNVTYGIVGEKLGYWDFFPVESGWGIIPVWGFADVVDTQHADIKKGERFYGYFPMGTHLIMRPGHIKETRFSDISIHRAELFPVYNSYVRVNNESYYDDAMDNERMLLFPLYATSFCLSDFLKDNDYFGATQIIIPSASSKTAIGLAYALRADDISQTCVGLTSPGNREQVESLGLYDVVAVYSALSDVDTTQASVIVDMSGNGAVLSELHELLGENMKFTSNVGLTHFDANEMGRGFIRERSAMFFAPAHIKKRTAEWGPGEFQKRAYRFWHEASLRSRDWLVVDQQKGMDALTDVFAELREGRVSPDRGIVVSF
jgi:hypothetical protein